MLRNLLLFTYFFFITVMLENCSKEVLHLIPEYECLGIYNSTHSPVTVKILNNIDFARKITGDALLDSTVYVCCPITLPFGIDSIMLNFRKAEESEIPISVGPGPTIPNSKFVKINSYRVH